MKVKKDGYILSTNKVLNLKSRGSPSYIVLYNHFDLSGRNEKDNREGEK